VTVVVLVDILLDACSLGDKLSDMLLRLVAQEIGICEQNVICDVQYTDVVSLK